MAESTPEYNLAVIVDGSRSQADQAILDSAPVRDSSLSLGDLLIPSGPQPHPTRKLNVGFQAEWPAGHTFGPVLDPPPPRVGRLRGPAPAIGMRTMPSVYSLQLSISLTWKSEPIWSAQCLTVFMVGFLCPSAGQTELLFLRPDETRMPPS